MGQGRGFFITLEGGEGAGKTTQIKRLEQQLKAQGHNVVTTREPGGTPAAEEIRGLLSSAQFGTQWSPLAELLLINAAREMHVRDIIAPALTRGDVVISDRFIDSTRVYQGFVRGVDMDFIKQLERQVLGTGCMPDITLILDLPVDTALERVAGRGADHHYDRAGKEFYQKLRDGFIEISKMDASRCAIIDATGTPEEIETQIWQQIAQKL